jgi:glutathione S-transferase
LTAEGIDFEERDATSRDDWKQELFEVSPRGVVPTIVGDGTTIGWNGEG